MKLFFKLFLLLSFPLIVSCHKNEELVNYKKPYLEMTYKNRTDQINITMHDYETKQHKKIDSRGLKEVMPSYLNPYNNDYLITSRISCEVLVIQLNGTSKLFNPCQQAKVPENASLNDGLYYGKEYFLVTFNQGFASNGKNYNYTLGIFNNDYELIDTLKLKQQPYYFNIANNKLTFITMESLFSGYNILNTYNIKDKKLSTKKLDFKDTKDYFIYKNNNYFIDDNCQLYQDNKRVKQISSRCSSVQPTYQYLQDDDMIIHSFFIFKPNNDDPIDAYLKININDAKKTKIVTDSYCLNNQSWYAPQGKYCLGKDNVIVFNDFKNKPVSLKIRPQPNITTNYGFFNWE